MPNGFADLGNLLVGGNQLAEQDAFYKGQGQRGQLEHLSAQTQSALEQAKIHQIDAQEKQRAFEAKGRAADIAMQLGIAKNADEARAYGDAAMGDLTNLTGMVTSRGGLQEQGFRDKLANPALTSEARLAASSGIQGKLQLTGEGGAQKTPHQSDYEYLKDLPPAEKDQFGRVLRSDQTFNVGGVPTVRSSVVPGAATPVAPVGTVVENTRDIAAAKKEGAGLGARTMDLPQAKARFATSNMKQDDLIARSSQLAGDDELWKGTGLYKHISEIPGTQGARIKAQLDTLINKLSVQAVQEARDLSKTGGAYGNTSTREWESLGQSFAALDRNMAPDDMRRELGTLVNRANNTKAIMSQAFYDTYPELKPAGPPAPGAAPSAEKGPAVGVIESGYRFKGGDPANSANWEKQ